MEYHARVATAIFLGAYVLIALGENSPRKVDRPTAALIGAVLMVVTGVLSRAQATAAIDFSTLALLFGMMVLLAVLIQSELPTRLAFGVLRRCKSPHALLGAVIMVSGIASALMLNDTVCLLGAPILILLFEETDLPPTPFLLALATASNIGSAMTLTGNPQNMIIGSASGWGWSEFAVRMAPTGLVCLLVDWLILSLIYRRELSAVAMPCGPIGVGVDVQRKLAVRSMLTFLAFTVALMLGAPMDLAAVTAAAILLVWINRPPSLTFERVDWSLLVFFAGLFVVVEGFARANEGFLAETLSGIGSQVTAVTTAKTSAVTVLGSNIFSNVPFVLIARHWVKHTSDPRFVWLLLALTSTFAGNLTLFGSVANIIVAQKAQGRARLTFMDFLRAGIPVTLATTAIGVAMLYGLRTLGWV